MSIDDDERGDRHADAVTLPELSRRVDRFAKDVRDDINGLRVDLRHAVSEVVSRDLFEARMQAMASDLALERQTREAADRDLWKANERQSDRASRAMQIGVTAFLAPLLVGLVTFLLTRPA